MLLVLRISVAVGCFIFRLRSYFLLLYVEVSEAGTEGVALLLPCQLPVRAENEVLECYSASSVVVVVVVFFFFLMIRFPRRSLHAPAPSLSISISFSSR